MEKIINNENKKLSRNRKRRIGRKNKLNDDVKLILNKLNQKRKRNLENLIKLKNWKFC